MYVTVNGPRYYPEELRGDGDIKAAMRQLNTWKFRLYDALYFHTFFPGSERDVLDGAKTSPLYEYARTIGMGSLYANVICGQAKGVLESQISNRKNYISKKEDDISSITEKIKKTEDALKKKLAVKASLAALAKTGKWKAPYRKCTLKAEKTASGEWTVRGWKVSRRTAEEYECAMERDIRKLKGRKAALEEAQRRKEKELQDLRMLPPKRAIFGGRPLFRQKDTIGASKEWKKAFSLRRYGTVSVSGRADSRNGNFIMKKDLRTKDLVWTLPDGKTAVFPNFVPKRYGDMYLSLLSDGNASHTAFCYTVKAMVDGNGKEYYVVSVSFELPEEKHLNNCFVTGCVGMDTNVDRLALTDVDEYGRALDRLVIPMRLEGLSSGQAKDAIGRAVSLAMAFCEKKKKPLVMEDLDKSGMTKGMRYGWKKRNGAVSAFAAEKIRKSVLSQSYRKCIGVTFIDPRYTSFMGKVLYMRKAGESVHEAASCVIAQMGLGIRPEVPDGLRFLLDANDMPGYVMSSEGVYYWRWRTVYAAMKGIPTHAYYGKIPELKEKKDIGKWKRQALKDLYKNPKAVKKPA